MPVCAHLYVPKAHGLVSTEQHGLATAQYRVDGPLPRSGEGEVPALGVRVAGGEIDAILTRQVCKTGGLQCPSNAAVHVKPWALTRESDCVNRAVLIGARGTQ